MPGVPNGLHADICGMGRSNKNKWIFGTVLGIVTSIPFLIPGCTPLSDNGSGTDPILGMVAVSAIQPSLDMANMEASATGKPTSLQDVLTVTQGPVGPDGGGGSKLVPVYVVDGDHLNVAFGTGPTVCVVSVSTGKAVAQC